MIEAIKLIWDGFKWLLGILKALLGAGWAVITGVITAIGVIWVSIVDSFAYVVSSAVWLWDLLAGTRDSVDLLNGAGVPTVVSNGAAFMANFVPFQYILSCVAALVTARIVTVLFRMIKSWVPTVN